ncbi:DUF6470 family protein [Kyrpidia tusciae]|uniref:DUF6470 family protein n=1 Tax=Kyrpidia tusciae TaxID=33943 RepID=UPI002ADDF150|nr:DUF6470 family protein [Kyrpidia tusciae]
MGLQTRPPEWRIAQPPADLNMHQELARVEIRRTAGRLEIDQSEAFAQVGLMSPLELSRSEAARSRQVNADGIAEAAQWGDRFAHIERGGNPIADWALREVTGPPDWIPALVPRPFSVHITYRPGQADIRVQPGRVDLNPAVHPPEVSFHPGTVDAYVRRPGAVTIIPPPLPGLLVDERG